MKFPEKIERRVNRVHSSSSLFGICRLFLIKIEKTDDIVVAELLSPSDQGAEAGDFVVLGGPLAMIAASGTDFIFEPACDVFGFLNGVRSSVLLIFRQ